MTWRLPWVSRAEATEIDRLRAIAGHVWNYLELRDPRAVADWITGVREEVVDTMARLIAANTATKDERTRYDDLLARYHALKLQGFAEPTPVVPREVPKPDPVKSAIAKRAGSNRARREQIEIQVAEYRLAGLSEDEIALRVVRGVSLEDLTEAGLMTI